MGKRKPHSPRDIIAQGVMKVLNNNNTDDGDDGVGDGGSDGVPGGPCR